MRQEMDEMREKLMEARTEVEHANDAAHYEIKKRQSNPPRPPAEIPGREIRGRAAKTARNFLKKESGQKQGVEEAREPREAQGGNAKFEAGQREAATSSKADAAKATTDVRWLFDLKAKHLAEMPKEEENFVRLLAEGEGVAALDFRDPEAKGRTALLRALSAKRSKLFTLLLEQGADPMLASSAGGEDCFDVASVLGDTQYIKACIKWVVDDLQTRATTR